MSEKDQHGEMSPSSSDDGSEEQQLSYHSESEDIANLQDKWPSFSQTASHALGTLTGKAKTENISENINNSKGGLESPDASKLSDEAANQQNCGQATQRHESGGSSGKIRHSRWDTIAEEGGIANEGECSGKKKRSRWAAEEPKISMVANEGECSGKKKRSRWAAEPKITIPGQIKLPDFMKKLADNNIDPEKQALSIKLSLINQRLQTGNVIVESKDGQRSPSPEPQYNNMGFRINTREFRAREKLLQEREMIIARLIEKQPALRPNHAVPKPFYQKIYIPVKEYPGYNFIGLIMGPCGKTHKEMEQETGANIKLRGIGAHKSSKFKDPSDNEDLHVLVEADDKNSLEKACRMVEKLLVPVEDGKNLHKLAQLRELAKMKGNLRPPPKLCQLCGQEAHVLQKDCPIMQMAHGDEHSTINNPMKVSLQGAKVDATNPHDLCFELGTGRSTVSMENSGSGIPKQSIQPLDPTNNFLSRLAQAGGLEHPQNVNTGMGPEITRVSLEKRGAGLPIQSSQSLAVTNNYMSWLAGGLEHPENGNDGILPGKVSIEKGGFRLPGQSTQPLGLTDNYISWLAGGMDHPKNVNAGIEPEIRKVSIEKTGSGIPRQSTQLLGLTDNTGTLQHPESGKDGIGPEIRKASLEKSGSGLSRQSSQPLGLRDSYMSWLAEGLEHTSDGSAGIGPNVRRGSGFGTSSIQGTRPYVYSSYSSHVGVETSFDSPSFSHMGLGPNSEHSHGKETDHSNVYVGCLPPTMEEEQLIKLFSSFGRIVEAKVIRDPVNGSSKGYGFVKFDAIHCAVQATAHMNGYRLEGKTLAVRVVGRLPSGSGVGPAEGLYTFDKQPPRLPVHSGDYAQPSWSAPTRPVSSLPYNPYSDNNGSGITSHSISPLQGGTVNSLPATSYCTYGPYQMPLHSAETSSGMQGPTRSQLVLGNVHNSSMSKLNIHSADAMTQFSPNQGRLTTYQRYAHPSIPSDSACSESPSRGSLMGGLVTPPWSSSFFSSGYQKKAVELEYERYLADEMGP